MCGGGRMSAFVFYDTPGTVQVRMRDYLTKTKKKKKKKLDPLLDSVIY